MRRVVAGMLAVLLAVGPLPARAVTAPSLAGRVVIDGVPTEYTPDEAIFGTAPGGGLEEPEADSAWGPDNDVSQIHITWDRDSIYVSGEGVIWGNNMIVFFDVVPDRGMTEMGSLESWRRNFSFSEDFRPDLFLATWDGNTAPRLLVHRGGNQVQDNVPGSNFRATATFSTNQQGRAMEFAIPWDTFFLGSVDLGTTPTFVPSLGETVHVFTAGTVIKVAAVVTGGGDGTGGPDSAPDNTRGHSNDANQNVLVDNYVSIELDRSDDTGLGAGGPDGVADWGVEPASRATFKIQPPVAPVRLQVVNLRLDRPAIAPDRGERARFRFDVEPPPVPGDALSQS
ncbi:MAG: hypothetical protein ABIP29_11255, partial [Candidatus Eisenbacteria bacterium]